MNLPLNTTSGHVQITETKVIFLHGTAPVYYPAPDGATYCNSATCTHSHPDTREGYEAAQECGAKLARIIAQGRLPKWATLDAPIASDARF